MAKFLYTLQVFTFENFLDKFGFFALLSTYPTREQIFAKKLKKLDPVDRIELLSETTKYHELKGGG